MIKDARGINLKVGDILCWVARGGALCRVVEISDAGIVNPITRTVSPPKLKVEIEFHLQMSAQQPIPALAEFVVVPDVDLTNAQHQEPEKNNGLKVVQ